MLFCRGLPKRLYGRAVEWDRSSFPFLFVQTVMLNVARDHRIDKGVDRLTRADTIADLSRRDEDGVILGVDDPAGSDALCKLGSRRRTAACQDNEPRQLEKPFGIPPCHELRDVIVADDPVE